MTIAQSYTTAPFASVYVCYNRIVKQQLLGEPPNTSLQPTPPLAARLSSVPLGGLTATGEREE